MTAKEKAIEIHDSGFNCAQSVLCSLEEYTGLDRKTALAMAGGFGGGVRCGEICGSLTGGIMAIGACCPFNNAQDTAAKDKIATLTKLYTGIYKNEFGCIRCLDLKQSGHTCEELIAFGAEQTEKIIKENKGQE